MPSYESRDRIYDAPLVTIQLEIIEIFQFQVIASCLSTSKPTGILVVTRRTLPHRHQVLNFCARSSYPAAS